MKYIVLNIKKFIRNECILFSLFAVCILVSVISVLFAFGMSQNLKREELNSHAGVKEVGLEWDLIHLEGAPLDEFLECLYSLDDSILNKCYIILDLQLKEDFSSDNFVNDAIATSWTYFKIRNGKITAALEKNAELEMYDAFVSGSGFTKEQVENGELVCVAKPDYWYDDEYEESKIEELKQKYKPRKQGIREYGGKEYVEVGLFETPHYNMNYLPMVPVTTIDAECYVRHANFIFSYYLSEDEYAQLKEAILRFFGTNLQFQNPEIEDVELTKSYYITLVQCVLIMVVAAIIMAVLFQYILLIRRRQVSIYRICGLSLNRVYVSCLVECFLYTVIFGGFGGVIFHFGLLPYFKTIYIYMGQFYTVRNYILLGAMYILVIVIVEYIMIKQTIKPQILKMIKGV